MEETKGKKPIYKKWWFWAIIVVVMLIAANSNNKPSSTVTQEGTPSQQTNQPAATTAPKELQWVPVKKWSGSGIKKTETFDITGKQWRINWKNKEGQYGSGVLQIYVYRPGKDMMEDLAANTMAVGGDTSYIYKSGTFYLNINASAAWEVEVEEQR